MRSSPVCEPPKATILVRGRGVRSVRFNEFCKANIAEVMAFIAWLRCPEKRCERPVSSCSRCHRISCGYLMFIHRFCVVWYHAKEQWFRRFTFHAHRTWDHGAYGCRQRHQLKSTL